MKLGEHIRDKVSSINMLMDYDNNKRNLHRGQVALENITRANIAKQKKDISLNESKVETIGTLAQNNLLSMDR